VPPRAGRRTVGYLSKELLALWTRRSRGMPVAIAEDAATSPSLRRIHTLRGRGYAPAVRP
jgi:hypothetical protein